MEADPLGRRAGLANGLENGRPGTRIGLFPVEARMEETEGE